MRSVASSLALALLLASGTANATIIATGGGPGISVQGFLVAEATDPLAISRSEDYDLVTSDANGNGSLPGFGGDAVGENLAEYDGENTVVGSWASASYTYSFFHDGGNLANGSLLLSSYSGLGIDDTYFTNPGDLAAVRSAAQAINFMDLAISGADYLLYVSGLVQDDNLHTQNGGGSAFSFVADVTSGFTLLGYFGDATANDFDDTVFDDSFTLLAGHSYRIGMGASTDAACAETTGAGLCPTQDGEGAPLDILGPGGYSQQALTALSFTLTPVPEPGTFVLLGVGIALVALRARRPA